ncbi:MAG: elongation factor P hydroxylase [Glaciecola sp.]|jgi:elongation factor P hydroxylase|uniref:elongation factor P hydroxylase n=1 Tax=Congregibacter sp. TaxID=2744308 RepID=UPI0039E32C68
MNSALSLSKELNAETIVKVFNDLFLESYSTCLQGSAIEPLYEPETRGVPARISFRADYVSSALHEIAHWSIAGAARRARIDYGYWYDPDGRSEKAQANFMAAEAWPQALEWCFSQACGIPFRLSLDNLDAPPDPAVNQAFASAVFEEANRFALQGLPPRAMMMFQALGAASGTKLTVSALQFSLEDLL